MTRWLQLYLAVTGVGTVLVLAMPWLVVMGLIAFIVPGVLLYLTPTAFLWGLLFALGWWATEPWVGAYGATAASGLVGAAVLVGLPMMFEARAPPLDTVETQDPETPIRLHGHVQVHRVRPPWDQRPEARRDRGIRPYACDALCLALLFEPEVTHVTVDRVGPPGALDERSSGARTMALVPRTGCEDSVPHTLYTAHPLFGATDAVRRVRFAAWEARLRDEVCIVEVARPAHADVILLEERRMPGGRTRRRWSLWPWAETRTGTEVHGGDGGRLAANANVSRKVVAWPLHIGVNGDLTHERFGWARRVRHAPGYGEGPIDLEEAMAAWTTLLQDSGAP